MSIDNTENTETPEEIEVEEVGPEQKLHVVMDSFGGDWTPFAVFYDAEEALRLQDMLEADANAKVVPAPYFATKQAVRDAELSDAPEDLDSVTVTFDGTETVAVSESVWAAREYQFRNGGLHGETGVYETAEDVVQDKPSAVGQFIVSEMTADDILDIIN